jgi:hypothetical protein
MTFGTRKKYAVNTRRNGEEATKISLMRKGDTGSCWSAPGNAIVEGWRGDELEL